LSDAFCKSSFFLNYSTLLYDGEQMQWWNVSVFASHQYCFCVVKKCVGNVYTRSIQKEMLLKCFAPLNVGHVQNRFCNALCGWPFFVLLCLWSRLYQPRVWNKPLLLLKKGIFCFFKMKQVFVFSRKIEKPYFEVFLLHHAFQSRTRITFDLLCIWWHSKLRVNKSSLPHLCLRSVVGQFTPKW